MREKIRTWFISRYQYVYLIFAIIFLLSGSYLIIEFIPLVNLLSVESILSLGFSTGVSLLSLSFAFIAFFGALMTDIKIREISNMMFLQACSDFEYIRMQYINTSLSQLSTEAFLWRSLICSERIAEINKNHVKENNQYRFINYFCATIENLLIKKVKDNGLWNASDDENIKYQKIKSEWNTLDLTYKKKVVKMLLIVMKYKRNERTRDRLNKLLDNFLDKNSFESEECFRERIINQYNLSDYLYL